ncbi:hypothetical protein AgCh_000983 [Apium graveolens]
MGLKGVQDFFHTCFRNVPYDWINKRKSNQNWLRKGGENFLFPSGGTIFLNGVGAYIDMMEDLILEMKNGTIRTAIDTGCRVARWGGDVLDRGILTVSLAQCDNHEERFLKDSVGLSKNKAQSRTKADIHHKSLKDQNRSFDRGKQ